MNKTTLIFNAVKPSVAWAVVWREDQPVGLVFAQEEGFRVTGNEKFLEDVEYLWNEISSFYERCLKGELFKEDVAFLREKAGSYELEYVGLVQVSLLGDSVPRRADLFWNAQGHRLYLLHCDRGLLQVYSKGLTEKEVVDLIAEVFFEGYQKTKGLS